MTHYLFTTRTPHLITAPEDFAHLPWPTTETARAPQNEHEQLWQAGLVAIGGQLTPEWLLAAYREGIFPWFAEGQPILWWRLSPRMVLPLAEFHAPTNLQKQYRRLIARGQPSTHYPNSRYQVRCNTAFAEVIKACATAARAAAQEDAPATWITPAMQAAYLALHHAGYAYSVEVWRQSHQSGETLLVGGLYGLSIGRMVFGESMFFHESQMSQIALMHLVQFLRQQEVQWLDCQQQTAHLARFGARAVPLTDFLARLKTEMERPALPWHQWRS